MQKRLFVVVNPSQYLYAIEYAFMAENAENHILIMTPFPAGIEAIDALGNGGFWHKVHFLDLKSYKGSGSDRKFWNDCWRLLSKTFFELLPDELVAGSLVDGILYPFILKNKKRINQLTVLDDGTPTLAVTKKLREGGFFYAYHFRSFRILMKYLVYLNICPLFYSIPRSLKVFSMFKVPLRKGDVLVENNFSWLKTKKTNLPIESKFVFVGSHLVDRKLMHKMDYLNSIQSICNRALSEGFEMVYVHHRGESKEMREAIANICTTMDFNAPLEFVYLNQSRPKVLGGHFSSALFTMSRIYPETEVRAYLLPDDTLLGTAYEPKEYVLEVQQALRQDGFVKVYNGL